VWDWEGYKNHATFERHSHPLKMKAEHSFDRSGIKAVLLSAITQKTWILYIYPATRILQTLSDLHIFKLRTFRLTQFEKIKNSNC
jgi:hypothetical protein